MTDATDAGTTLDDDTLRTADSVQAGSITECGHESAKKRRSPLKIVLIVLGVLLALVIIVVIAINIYVRVAFASFYDQTKDEFSIPGIESGFIPQDLDYYDMGETWLFSGYMNDGSASPLYKRYVDGTETVIYVNNPDGTPYTGHGSAITSTDSYIYLTCEEGYLVLDAWVVNTSGEDQIVTALDKVDLDFTPAFMNIENDELIAGNFYTAGAYETPEEHHIQTTDGTNRAIMCAYPMDEDTPYGFATVADRVYSIPDQVQGICTSQNGLMMFSTSYGLAPSHLLIYDGTQLESEGTFNIDGHDVPLYVLDSRSFVEDITAPPMTEGIETHNGRIYISEESASNKYIFGKLYGAGQVYSIPVPA